MHIWFRGMICSPTTANFLLKRGAQLTQGNDQVGDLCLSVRRGAGDYLPIYLVASDARQVWAPSNIGKCASRLTEEPAVYDELRAPARTQKLSRARLRPLTRRNGFAPVEPIAPSPPSGFPDLVGEYILKCKIVGPTAASQASWRILQRELFS